MNLRETAVLSVLVLVVAAGCVGQGSQNEPSPGVLMASQVEQPPENVDPVEFSSSALADSPVARSVLERADETGTMVSEDVNGSEVETLRNQLSNLPQSSADDDTYYLEYKSNIYKLVLKLED
jgi:hypothetical protein